MRSFVASATHTSSISSNGAVLHPGTSLHHPHDQVYCSNPFRSSSVKQEHPASDPVHSSPAGMRTNTPGGSTHPSAMVMRLSGMTGSSAMWQQGQARTRSIHMPGRQYLMRSESDGKSMLYGKHTSMAHVREYNLGYRPASLSFKIFVQPAYCR